MICEYKNMKRILILLLCCISMLQVVAQNNEYKFYTLEECKNDTVLFFDRNYGEVWIAPSKRLIEGMGLRYKNCPLKVLFDEARQEGIVFKSFWFEIYPVLGTVSLYFYMDEPEQAERKWSASYTGTCLCVKVNIGRHADDVFFKSREQEKFYPLKMDFYETFLPKLTSFEVSVYTE